jgi:type II secretory pathway pseudopilin PulG
VRACHSGHGQRVAGFTLVEILVVVGLMLLMMTMLIPAAGGLIKASSRRGAVAEVFNAFERARAAAVESGSNVYVGFAGADFAVSEMRYRAFIVFRERSPEDLPPSGTAGASRFVLLTKWQKLPTGVSLKSESRSGDRASFRSIVNPVWARVEIAPSDGFPRVESGDLPVIVFDSLGAVAEPVNAESLRVFIYEGFFDGQRDVLTQSSSGLFDLITVSRFTGRARLEVSAI